jgi:spore coat protein U-like protein
MSSRNIDLLKGQVRSLRRLVHSFSLLIVNSSVALANCTITNFTMNFGSLNVLSGSPTDVTATGSITCLLLVNTAATIGISCGAGSNCTANLRTMVSGSNTMRVEYYTDSARTQVWQADSFSVNPGSYTGAGDPITLNLVLGTTNFTVYGRIPAGQSTVQVGSYTWTGAATPAVKHCGDADLLCVAPVVSTSASASTAVATVVPQCSILSTSPVSFTAGLLTANTTAIGTVNVQCTAGASYTVALDNGQNYSGSRRVANAAQTVFVPYQLYQDSSYSVSWGAQQGVNTQADTGTGLNQALSVYGLIPAQATTPAPGVYSDTVVVTVTY